MLQASKLVNKGTVVSRGRNGNIVHKAVQTYGQAAETLPEATGFLPPCTGLKSQQHYLGQRLNHHPSWPS